MTEQQPLDPGDTVQVTIEGTVITTTQGSFIAVSFRDAYANLHTLWFSGMNKIERVRKQKKIDEELQTLGNTKAAQVEQNPGH